MNPHNPWQAHIEALVNARMQELDQKTQRSMNAIAAMTRKSHEETAQRMEQGLTTMADVLRQVSLTQSGYQRKPEKGILRIEDIPGKRIPFDYMVTIPINASDMVEQSQTFTVSQEGPFVATHRWAAFLSLHEAQVTVDDVTASFQTRSYGRYRPIHSVTDLLDGHGAMTTTLTNPLTEASYLAAVGLPSNISNFRSMQFDGLVTIQDQGATLPRQNGPIPTTQWAEETNKAVPLSALDMFERSTIVQITVRPTHINNPAAGNVSGDNVFGSAGWPFLAGQYDPHEGIVTPDAFSSIGADGVVNDRATNDSVTRAPNGILYIGFRGYRIMQPPGFAGV